MSCGADQQSMTAFVGRSENKFAVMNPRQKSLTNLLITNLIVNCGLPLAIIYNPHFQKFINELEPKFSPPCRQTVSYSILPQMLQAKQKKLQDFLDSCTYMALTVDIWTDRRAHAFLGITIHAFDKGNPVSHLLVFKAFQGSHTGQRIAEALETVLTENHIQNKVRYVVTDNASNMKKAMSVLFDDGKDRTVDDDADPSLWEDDGGDDIAASLNSIAKRLSCFAHSLQLVIRDGLTSLTAIKPALGKCSKLANMLHQSALTTKEFSQLQELVKILEPFAEATDLTQGDKMVTISCVVPVVLSLTRMLASLSTQVSTFSPLIKNLIQVYTGF